MQRPRHCCRHTKGWLCVQNARSHFTRQSQQPWQMHHLHSALLVTLTMLGTQALVNHSSCLTFRGGPQACTRVTTPGACRGTRPPLLAGSPFCDITEWRMPLCCQLPPLLTRRPCEATTTPAFRNMHAMQTHDVCMQIEACMHAPKHVASTSIHACKDRSVHRACSCTRHSTWHHVRYARCF